jgi:hypothetical protein
MTADVYAGDDDLRHAARIRPAATRFRYRIECDAEADALGRICNQLNFANAAPWRLELVTTDGGQLVVDVELRGIAAPLAELIRRKLLQQTCVTRVELYVPG